MGVFGAIGPVTTTVSSATSLTAQPSQYILCDTSAGSFAVTLPPATGNTNLTLSIKKVTTDTNKLTISPQSGETIDGISTFYTTSTQRPSYDLIAVNSNWIFS